MELSINNIISENAKRNAKLHAYYNPVYGIGSPIPRFEFKIDLKRSIWLPETMKREPSIKSIVEIYKSLDNYLIHAYGDLYYMEHALAEINMLRFKHDFEFWAITCVIIQDKDSKKEIPFKLNSAQREYLQKLEEDRVSNTPIRFVLLKARQWGGSTLTQIYFAWIQLIHRENWHSVIVGEIEKQSRKIRSMYNRLLKNYPSELGKFTLTPFENSQKERIIKQRGCIITMGSMQNPDFARSDDNAMNHSSEVGKWKETETKRPEDLVRAVRETIPYEPYTIDVMESTADGFGTFFHHEYLDAKEGRSLYKAIFIPWFHIDRDWMPIKDIHYVKFIEENLLGTSEVCEYNRFLWKIGATLEGIKWYHHHKKEKNYREDIQMKRENPSTDIEAFENAGRKIYSSADIENIRKLCTPPPYKGQLFAKATKNKEALQDLKFEPTPDGDLWIWKMPDKSIRVSDRYVVTMDIGGKTYRADWSVIRVFDRYNQISNGPPEAIATWRGHVHTDILGWIGVQIAEFYNHAFLIPEANYLVRDNKNTEGSNLITILNEIGDFYDNIFTRINLDDVKETLPTKYGCWMTDVFKGTLSDKYMEALRIGGYIERDERVLDEAEVYEIDEVTKKFGAVKGYHDDLLIATQIGYWACVSYMDLPHEIKESDRHRAKIPASDGIANF